MNRVDALHQQYVRARAAGRFGEARRALRLLHEAGFIICPSWRVLRQKGMGGRNFYRGELTSRRS